MGRIDDALRRAGSGSTDNKTGDRDTFAAAWEVKPAVAVPRAVMPAAEVPAGSGRGLVSFSSRWKERMADGLEGDPALVEQFRRLAGVLHHAQQSRGLRTVMVTSAVPGDGKTLTSVNLALVLAESYRANVLLVDADLRRPSIPGVIESDGGFGLSDVLRAPTDKPLALLPLTPRLTLLPAGQPIANSLEALTSPRMAQIMAEAKTRFDWVILDAPPVGPAADARLLTGLVDGTLLVIRAGQTQHPDVVKAIDTLGREQLLGVVLNGVEVVDEPVYYGPTSEAGPT